MLKVLEMNPNKIGAGLSVPKRRWLRHQATNIVAQLPEDEAEALFVLDHARKLVLEFLRDEPDGRPKLVNGED